MIHYSTPWNSNKNLAQAYREVMGLVNDEDYVVFTDGDTTVTTDTYGRQIEEILKANPEVHFFTAMTNRVATDWQRSKVIVDNNDIEYHRSIGFDFQKIFGLQVEDCTNKSPWSGFFMVIKKASWHGIELREGILGVDNDIHHHAQKIGQKVYLMKGVYLYHWYSGFMGKQGNIHRDKSHLI